MNGPTGLDYCALPIVLRMRRVQRSEWDDLLSMIQVMEDEALKVMHKR
jgi:hypothetical protein